MKLEGGGIGINSCLSNIVKLGVISQLFANFGKFINLKVNVRSGTVKHQREVSYYSGQGQVTFR